MTSKLQAQWFIGVNTPKEKDSLEKTLLSSNDMVALMRLKKILKHRLQELNTKETSTEVYNNPNWHYLQADLNGARRELEKVVTLLSFVKDI